MIHPLIDKVSNIIRLFALQTGSNVTRASRLLALVSSLLAPARAPKGLGCSSTSATGAIRYKLSISISMPGLSGHVQVSTVLYKMVLMIVR